MRRKRWKDGIVGKKRVRERGVAMVTGNGLELNERCGVDFFAG